MTIAITGATGQLGRLVVAGLKKKVPANELIALVRSPAKATSLGVAAREFDYDNPDTLAPALAGVDTLLLISANEVGKRERQHKSVIDAAKKAGVKRIVYTSLLRADSSPLDLAPEHLATEEAIKASGIPYTILRNGWYTENYTGSIGGALAGGAFLGSARDGRISSASRADYAAAAVAVLTSKGHEGKTYELAGDEAWTLNDFASEISKHAGKTIPYRDLPEKEYASTLSSFGVPQGFADLIAGWDTGAAKGALYEDSHQLSKLIGRPTTPMRETVDESLRKQGS
jgi:NAD(P)H dehydrogenase (quinone)